MLYFIHKLVNGVRSCSFHSLGFGRKETDPKGSLSFRGCRPLNWTNTGTKRICHMSAFLSWMINIIIIIYISCWRRSRRRTCSYFHCYKGFCWQDHTIRYTTNIITDEWYCSELGEEKELHECGKLFWDLKLCESLLIESFPKQHLLR